MNNVFKNKIISVIGLGYVGLPLAVEFGKHYKTIGFDINSQRISDLKEGKDRTLELNKTEIDEAANLLFSSSNKDIENCDIYIITVPTPVNSNNQPDFGPIKTASKLVGSVLSAGNYVIYESTVYPGATEEVCVPILEKISQLSFNKDFFCGYSPERINPGDKEHTLTKIIKVTSGSTPAAAETINMLYNSIITAGTFKASSIKVAEAAKVIENTQRDVNIGLINELSIIFDKLDIKTDEVLEAAGTKWNFLNFKPGLVGGHCIGVDPYYLTYKAQALGYHPEIILAGRRINDSMSHHISDKIIKTFLKKGIQIEGSKVLIMGLTFKENCPDLRNAKTFDVIKSLQNFDVVVDCHDPWVEEKDLKQYGFINYVHTPKKDFYDCVLLAVGHQAFKKLGADKIRGFCNADGTIFDIKSIFPGNETDLSL